MEAYRIPIDGMTCVSCASRVTRAVRKVEGVSGVKVDLANDAATVSFDAGRATLESIAAAVRAAGYEPRAELAELVRPLEERRRGLLGRLGLSS